MKFTVCRNRIIERISAFLVAVIIATTLIPDLQLGNAGSQSTAEAAPLVTPIPGTPYDSSGYTVSVPHVIINQVYGAGKDGYVSNSFIELYNPTDEMVDMGGWFVHYKSSLESEDGDWHKLELTSSINAHSSYLIKCAAVQKTKNVKYTISSCDQEWDQSLYNKGLSIVICSANGDFTGTVYNNLTKEPIVDNYVDMLAVGGNDETIEQEPLHYETSFNRIQSKKNAIKRKDFIDTDNNSKDTEAVDYSAENMDSCLPRKNSDGAWGLNDTSGNESLDLSFDLTSPKAGDTISILGLKNESVYEFKWKRDDEIIKEGEESEYTLTENDYEHWINVTVNESGTEKGRVKIYFSKLPVMYIDTYDKPIISKTEYISANMTLQGNEDYHDDSFLYGINGNTGSIQIKGRGNSTWSYAKKPYKIKLDKKTSLLGLGGKSKHWVLLANYLDESLMRNKLAYDLSEKLGVPVYMHSTWVDLILNGEFVGNYQLCEQIRIEENRINIYDWEKSAERIAETVATEKYPNSNDKDSRKKCQTSLEESMVEDLSWLDSGKVSYLDEEIDLMDYDVFNSLPKRDGGILYEMDYRYDETSKFISNHGMRVNIKKPEYVNTSEELFNYAKKNWNKYEEAILSEDGYNSDGDCYLQLADLDSMVGYWLIHELVDNYDARSCSRFAFQDISMEGNNKLIFGPIWDFDRAAAGIGAWPPGTQDPEGWTVTGYNSVDEFFKEWTDSPFFCYKAREKYWDSRELYEDIFKDGGLIDHYASYLLESGEENINLWRWKLSRGFAGDSGDVLFLKNYLRNRCNWLDKQFSTLDCLVNSVSSEYSAFPFTKSNDIIVLSTNAIEGISNKTDLITNMHADYYLPEHIGGSELNAKVLTVLSANEILVCVNDQRIGNFKVSNGIADVAIAKDIIEQSVNGMSVVELYVKGNNSESLGRSYFTVSCQSNLPTDIIRSIKMIDNLNGFMINRNLYYGDEIADLYRPSYANYEFKGWFYEDSDHPGEAGSKEFDIDKMPNMDIRLYAKYIPLENDQVSFNDIPSENQDNSNSDSTLDGFSDAFSLSHNTDARNIGSISSDNAKYIFDPLKSNVLIVGAKVNISEKFSFTKKIKGFNEKARHRYVLSNKRIAKIKKSGIVTPQKSGEIDVFYEQKETGGKWTRLGSAHLFIQMPKMKKKNIVRLSDNTKINAYSLLSHTSFSPSKWKSSKPSVASIDEKGNITIHKKGKVKILAVYDGNHGSSKKKYASLLVIKK